MELSNEQKKEILSSFLKVSNSYIANVNSLHSLGAESKKLQTNSTNQILEILNLKKKEVIYTSDNIEALNLLIYGLKEKKNSKNLNIISFNKDLTNIAKEYNVNYTYLEDVSLLDNLSNINLISFNNPASLSYMKKIKENYPNMLFHYDLTNSLGTVKNLDFLDFISFDLSKIGGMEGIGCLIKNNNIVLEPLIKGGKSTTNYRSGTPALPFITTLAKSLRLISEETNE